MMAPAENQKRSTLFGEPAIFFGRDSKIYKKNDNAIVRMGFFWYWFRKTLPITAPVLFVAAFLWPYFFFNSTDGFILSGGFLSLIFCFLSVLSYFHVLPWRRHPSSLLIQVCLMSFCLSMVAVAMAYPTTGFAELRDGTEINLVGSPDYDGSKDRTAGCLIMSFVMQLTLFAREMWIMTLSLDLLTNITNPFASYKFNLRKYHFFIWLGSTFSAFLLIGQRRCQGEFLTNGTCWLQITGIDSTCFWGYFMSWVILFYVNALSVLAYAFSRISKGLESTYATHYLFVVDTFRIVFFYFFYGVLLAGIFLLLYYASGLSDDQLLSLEHFFAFLIAARGFFDALIWFFTHGFADEQAEAVDSAVSMALLMKSISSRRLTLRDVFSPRGLSECFRLCACRPSQAEPARPGDDVTTILLSSSAAPSAQDRPVGKQAAQTSTARTAEESGSFLPRPSMPSATLRAVSSTVDFSPQLNLALRTEVLLVVTLGIRESVLKLNERERRLREYAQAVQSASQSSSQSQPAAPTSPERSRASDEADDFERVRLSSGQSEHQAEVGNILRDIYAGSAQQPYGRPSLLPSALYRPSTGLSTSVHSPPPPSAATGPGPKHKATPRPPRPQRSQSLHLPQPPSQASMGLHSLYQSGANSILHGLMAVTGAFLPGEYGVDHFCQAEHSRALHAADSLRARDQSDPPAPHPQQTQPTQESQSRTIFPFESPPSKQASYFLDTLERISKEPPLDLPPPPAEVVFQVDGKYRFRDFRPATFQKLRFLVGMSDEEYLHIISQPTQEKLSEGRSGAFFFVCGEGDLVVKTVESHEAGTLLSILDQYATHLMKNPASLLVRFLGLHAIRMYGNEFTFVVMKNIFPRGLQLNEKYDIKGSYVQRNAAMKFPGKLSTCRYCHEQFIEGSSDRCPEVIGSHEAIVTLKDNDMINKIRLSPEDAYQIIDTLFSDSDALCEMGLMDYSLLVGVKHAYYDLDLFRPRDSLGDNSNGNQSNNLLPGSSSLSRPQQLPQQSIQGSGLGSSLASLSAALEAGPVLGRYQQNAYAARAVIAPNEYYFGVIDILTTWSWSKKLERFFKVFVLGQPADGVSCVDPVEFKERYQRKITRIIEHEGFVREITGSWVGKREVGMPFALVGQGPEV